MKQTVAVPVVDCPVCQGMSAEIIRLKGGFSGRRCETCSIVFAQPMPTEAELEDYYSGWLFALPGDDQLTAWRSHTQRGGDEVLRMVQARRTAPITSALDYGGGLGFFARAIATSIEHVHLFDMSAASRNYASTAFAPLVKVHATANEALAAGPFDVILLNQVIEHIRDPVAFVKPILGALAVGGTVVISTPNNDMADIAFRLDLLRRYAGNTVEGRWRSCVKIMTNSWLCLDPPRHLYAFSARSLERVMQAAGAETQMICTRTWRDDPLGYPMYANARPGIARRINAFYRRGGSAVAEMVDRRRRHGNTLIGFFGRSVGQEDRAKAA